MATHPEDFPQFLAAVGWQPPVDVYRNDLGWLVKLDLAGVRSMDVHIEWTSGGLIVRGCRRDVTVGTTWLGEHIEIAYSRFERLVELPASARETRVETHYEDGMLLVRLVRARSTAR